MKLEGKSQKNVYGITLHTILKELSMPDRCCFIKEKAIYASEFIKQKENSK
jgi:hypothetical protein